MWGSHGQKLPLLCSAPGRFCQRSWVGAPGRWTWSWRLKLKSCVTTRGSTSTSSSWLRRWPVSSPRSCRRRGSWATPSPTSASSHRNSMWVWLTLTRVTDKTHRLENSISFLNVINQNSAAPLTAHHSTLRRSLVTTPTPRSFWPRMGRRCWAQSTSSFPVWTRWWTKPLRTPCSTSSNMKLLGILPLSLHLQIGDFILYFLFSVKKGDHVYQCTCE